MKRTAKITLRYTREELLLILHKAITTSENVSIEAMKSEGEHIAFECIEGLNNVLEKEQLSKLNVDLLIPKVKQAIPHGGLKKAIGEELANGVICSLDDLHAKLELSGFHKTKASLRVYLKAKKDLYIEVNPNSFQLKEYFGKYKGDKTA